MATGAMPFSGATTSHTIVQILEKDPIPPSKVAQIPAELERIVLKAMAKRPDERYQTANDMLIDLRSLKKRLESDAEHERTLAPATPEDLGLAQKKKRVLVVAVIGMLLVTAAIFGINIWRSSRTAVSTPSVTPAASQVERTLTYWITVQKYKNGKPYRAPFTLAGEINFESDYQIRVNVRSAQSGYLYILNEGPSSGDPEYNVVFPTPTANKGSSLLASSEAVRIPEKSWLLFDNQQGVEKLWLVFSEDAVSELEQVKQFAGEETGGLIADPQRNKSIKDFLDTHSTTKPEVEKGETLTTIKTRGNLLVYAIKLEHH
jgi:hypothetical protein